jgi:CDP-diacylglycerol--glycerol-3-phosphate 3-phosphatidyltransferase
MKQHIPNFVTGLRIMLTPLIAFVIWQPQKDWLAALGLFLFIIASASDWLDGYLARQMNIISPVGRMLDPIADKLLVAACLLALAAGRDADAVFLVPALIILMREILVSGLREHLAGNKMVVPVSLAAKWKTAVQMTALGMLIGAPILGNSNSMIAETGGLVLLWVAAAMTVQTGVTYFRAGSKHL